MNTAKKIPPKFGTLISDGNELSSWAIEGGLIGAGIGLFIGVLFSIGVLMGFIDLPVVNQRLNGSMLAYMVAPFTGAFLGGFAGVLVGIGTPKFNPFPHQGRVTGWKSLFIVSRKGLSRLFIPKHQREKKS